MRGRFVSLGLAALLAWLGAAAVAPAGAQALSREAMKAQEEHIEAEYDAAQTRCKQLARQARLVCQEEARGARDIAAAELLLRYQPTPENDENLRIARAEAVYAVALRKCRALDGHARDVCRADAKAVFTGAKAEAKLQREVMAQSMRSEAAVRQRTELTERQAEAQFQAALQRCELLPGEGRENCTADARRRFSRP